MSDRIPTTEKLAKALEEANAPKEMILKARGGYYDDYKTTIATPIVQLVIDANQAGLQDIAERAKNGEFDAPLWESDKWASTDEAQEVLKDLWDRP